MRHTTRRAAPGAPLNIGRANRSLPAGAIGVTLLITTWFLLVGAGLTLLWQYTHTPGAAADPPLNWPAATSLVRDAKKANLLIFMHPHCPCSRATLGELERLMAQASGRVAAVVVFLKPPDVAAGWEKADLWRRAEAIPGVTVVSDVGSVEGQRFCAQTSGAALLYDRGGVLRFRGGITSSRGHEGDNAGRTAILALISGAEASLNRTSVYGCSLDDPMDSPRDEP